MGETEGEKIVAHPKLFLICRNLMSYIVFHFTAVAWIGSPHSTDSGLSQLCRLILVFFVSELFVWWHELNTRRWLHGHQIWIKSKWKSIITPLQSTDALLVFIQLKMCDYNDMFRPPRPIRHHLWHHLASVTFEHFSNWQWKRKQIVETSNRQ